MKYRVRLLPRACRDIETLYAWVERQAPHQGMHWYNGLMQTIKTLEKDPHQHTLAHDGFDARQGVRHLLYGRVPYVILLWIKKKDVEILHIRRSRGRLF